MSRDMKIVLIVVGGLLACCVLAFCSASVACVLLYQFLPTPTPTAHAAIPTRTLQPPPTYTPVPSSTPHTWTPFATDTPTPYPPLPPTPTRRTGTLTPGQTPVATSAPLPAEIQPGPDGLTTEQRLRQTELPERDVRLLAERLKKVGPVPTIVHATPPTYEPGQTTQFWVGNLDTNENIQIPAVLVHVTPHLYVWVEEGVRHDLDALIQAAEEFEEKIYPTNRAFFGSEWTPGVDSDPRLHILHSTSKRMGSGIAGYYSSADEYSSLANPYSNEREMFYIAIDNAQPGDGFYEGVLAHEFQHMIHWANDHNEETWWNEGCSELAAYLNGYDPGGFDWMFIADPDVQLTSWPEGDESAANYGASYLFAAYVLSRFGEETMKQIIAHPENGTVGFDAVLAEQGLTFDEVFADWLVANYVDNLQAFVNDPRYDYPDHLVGPASSDTRHSSYPVERSSSVHQYAADYIELEGNDDFLITFQGNTVVRLVPADAHSGRYAWWSNRGDDSDATLTRAFDLRGVERATLSAWMWYDIEEDWDYAYVAVSTDDGKTWDLLSGPSSTTSNPNGNSFGPAYTGASGGWIEETFDLTPYAGKQILFRFEYVTDDAVNRAGMLIDDLRIPELGYEEDFEAGPGGWESGGFIYSDNLVAQRYLVQVILLGQETQVLRFDLDTSQRGTLSVRGLGRDFDSAVLVISALAPSTTEMASYTYRITVE